MELAVGKKNKRGVCSFKANSLNIVQVFNWGFPLLKNIQWATLKNSLSIIGWATPILILVLQAQSVLLGAVLALQ